MAAVVYDLIPLLFQEEYFPGGRGRSSCAATSRALNRLRSYDAVLAISESTRSDFLSLLGLSPDRVVTIGAASDGRFFVPDRTDPMPAESRKLLSVLGITRPFVFSVGDMDYRKNPWGLIDAFAMLPDELRRSHQLVLSYVLSEGGPRPGAAVRPRPRRRRPVGGDRLALGLGVAGRCISVARPSSSPRSYEGFGLPILEAMHCGAPVVAGNNSSQIEVVGDAGLLFNVADAGELAGHLVRLLEEPDRARELGERAVVQARRFSWEATADKALEVLTRVADAPESRSGYDPSRCPGRADAPRAASDRLLLALAAVAVRGRRTTRRGCWTS